jgi:HD-GYP domain-containing protein (c-di-GMP phosphodiesterase class II)/phage shock protein PspC (stress-responsive transcriptional regulator)
MGRFSGWNSYRGVPPALIRYLAAVSLAGPVLAIGWLLLGPATDRPVRWLSIAVLTILAGLAERFSIHLTHKTYISVASAVYVAMLLTMPLSLCGVAALLAVTAAQAQRFWARPALGIAEPLFNIGQTASYVTGAAACLALINAWSSPEVRIGDIPVDHVLIAACAMHALNSVLVAGASARHLNVGTLRLWRRNFLLDIGPYLGMTLVGTCAAQLDFASPLFVPALALPAVLVHRAVGRSVQLRANVREAMATLVEVVELRDPYTAGHSRRVAAMARTIALELGLTAEEADAIEDAGNVHDLGKVAIDPSVLLKPGKLTDAEWAEMKRHPVYGVEVLARFESYRAGLPLVRGHHESWDGSGYPDGLRGTAIPLGARILAVADTWDALTSDRPYRSGMARERAIGILTEGAGIQWDPDMVNALIRIVERETPGSNAFAIAA